MHTIKPGVLKDMHKQLAKYAFLHKLNIPVWEYTRGMFLGDSYETEDFKGEIKSGDYWYAAYDSAHFFKASITIPEEMDGKEIRAKLQVGGEALVKLNGKYISGATTRDNIPDRTEVSLGVHNAGEVLNFEIEATCDSMYFCDAAMDGAKYQECHFGDTFIFVADEDCEGYFFDIMVGFEALEFIKEGDGQLLNMMFHFEHMGCDNVITNWIVTPFRAGKLKKVYNNWQKSLHGIAWNANYIENHDQPRIISRYGSEKYRTESGKMLATMYICQSGTPFIYQGQEIGMTNIELKSLDEFKDMITFNNKKLCDKLHVKEETFVRLANRGSRENSRTPVQWNDGPYAGFSTVEPWFNLNPNYKEINVAASEEDENSILNYYRKLLKFRKENEVAIYGDFKQYYKNSKELFVYERNLDGVKVLVVASFTENAVDFKAPEGIDLSKGELVLANYDDSSLNGNGFKTKPYETRVYLFK